jgi:two-component system response regulator FixJ
MARRVVAVVDDDDAVRNSLRFLLEIAGHAVETFASGGEFLRAETKRLRCLILDQNMPGMTGLELAGKLRSDGSALPILLMTATVTPTMKARAAKIGVDRVLEKPFEEDELLGFLGAHDG